MNIKKVFNKEVYNKEDNINTTCSEFIYLLNILNSFIILSICIIIIYKKFDFYII